MLIRERKRVMRKEELLKTIGDLNLDKKKYCIIASGVMVMYGLKDECSDIDLRVSKDLFEVLLKKYNMKQSSRYDYVYELGNNIDVNCRNFNSDVISFIDGYPVESLELQLKWKEENNRPKDQEDIRLIREYLKRL